MNVLRNQIGYDSENIIYYNVLIPNTIRNNPSTNAIDCKYTETRTPPLLFNPEDWYISIIRFLVPAQLIPIFIFDAPSALDPISPYSVTLSFGGNDYQQFLQYVPLDNTQVIPNNTTNTSEFFYYVYNYNDMITYINTAFREAFARLKNDFPAVEATEPPFILYDTNTQLFSLYAQQTYGSTSTPAIEIYMNSNLERFFGDGFEFEFNGNNTVNGKDNLLLIRNFGTNSVQVFPPDIFFPNAPPPTWLNTIPYNINDTVYYQGDEYIAITNAPLWTSTTTYVIGNEVTYKNNIYISLTNGNKNNNPQTSGLNWSLERNINKTPNLFPFFWFQIVVPNVLPWFITKSYSIGDIVSFTDGLLYLSLTNANVGNTPNTSPANWTTNNLQLHTDPPLQWNQLTAYNIGDEVTYLGFIYISLTAANTGNNPQTSIANWQLATNFNYYQMIQDKPSIYSWQGLTSIVFVTQSIPVNNEYIKGLSNNTGVSNIFRPILTDFEPDLSLRNRDVYQYIPQAQYRYTELNGHTPLTVLDISVYWQDEELNLHQLLIPNGSVASIKFQFIKKDLYNKLKK